MKTVIEVDRVSKIYRLGQIGTGTLAEDIQLAIDRLRGKEYALKSAAENEQNEGIHVALQDVSFAVKEGEALGIIGKNGAGKSTLLKILSHITAPTTGKIKIKGRVASLLEVGTGFHPELSGKENIYLNGAILGMSKAEVKSKFDEIVDFSGVSKFIDTPVKRYSSGMYVRLAFAVAAHLEPEILIVDEVLAVGDADFQKKCLGKMKDVSTNHGRTVLFVSHNLDAVKNLCNNVVLLEKGKVIEIGNSAHVINTYFRRNTNYFSNIEYDKANAPGNEHILLRGAKIDVEGGESLEVNKSFSFNLNFDLLEDYDDLNYSLNLYGITGEHIFCSQSVRFKASKGALKAKCFVPANLLNNGDYTVHLLVVSKGTLPVCYFEHVLNFEVFDNRENEAWFGGIGGAVRPKLDWQV